MKFLQIAAAAAVLSLAVGSASAYATDEPVSAIGCGHMDRDANAAIDANASSSNVDAAKDEVREGRSPATTASTSWACRTTRKRFRC